MSVVRTVPLPFGRSQVSVEIPKPNLVGIFEPYQVEEQVDESALICEALENPIGTPRLRDLARPS